MGKCKKCVEKRGTWRRKSW